jgi:uncharacterized protein YfaS (alpha-2-macroglobulin family)
MLIAGAKDTQASADFEVSPAPRGLQVEVATGGVDHKPGEEIDVDVAVKDAAGSPVRAEVTLYAADEGSLSLANYRIPRPNEELYEHRRHLVRGFDAHNDRVRVGRLWGSHRAKAPSIRMGATSVNDGIREDFRQTVVFAPHLVTDATGHVRRKVALPDGLSTYRFMAVAAAEDDRTGAAESAVKTSLPLMARATLPRVIRVGDKFEASLVVSTRDLPAGDAQVSVETAGVALDAPARRALHLDPGVPAEVRFPVRAERPGTATLSFRVELGGARDAARVSREVVTPLVPETAAVDGETRAAVAEQLGDFLAVRPDYGGLDVTLASTPLAGLADGIEQLVEYPYGCTEQTVSRLVPLLALRDLALALTAKIPADKVDAALAEGVARVLRNQRADGGFGLWPESRESKPWVTAWALWGLGEARRRGVAVPDRAEARARAYLAGEGLRDDLALAAFLVDLAAEDGRPDAALTDRLLAARATLPPVAQAELLRALAITQKEPEVRRDLLRALESVVRLDGAAARAVIAHPSADILDSDARTTAMILRAIVAADPAHPLAPRLVRGLLEGRRGGRFRSTHEAAWALLALDAFRRARPEASGDLDARVFLGDALVREARAGKLTGFGVPMRDLLAARGQPLTFANDGAGTLHYQARLRFARAALPAEPEESGMFLRRTVRPLNASARPAGAFRAGEMAEVELVLVTPSPRSAVVVESPLPGGFEAVDADLRLGGSWLRELETSPWGRREVRDDRVAYFLDELPAGVWSFRYVVRASTPGTFITPPARAEEMYAPETFARTAAETTVVKSD